MVPGPHGLESRVPEADPAPPGWRRGTGYAIVHRSGWPTPNPEAGHRSRGVCGQEGGQRNTARWLGLLWVPQPPDGRAILAFDAGLQEETVKALGRWTSTKAMYSYLRGTPYTKAAWAARPMARALIGDGGGQQEFVPLPIAVPSTPPGPDKGPEDMLHNLSVRNNIHRMGTTCGPPTEWSTWCGWKWAATGAAGAYTLKDGTACTRCYRPG
eukprot:s2113_g2.t1